MVKVTGARALDSLILALAIFIALLIVTGGLHYARPGLKLELSEIDAFAWGLLLLLGIRYRRTGAWLPPSLRAGTDRLLAFFSRKPRFTLGIALAVYVALHTWISAWRYVSLQANAFDLSYLDQSLWSTTRVGFLHSTLALGQTYLGEHFSPGLGALSVLYRAWDSIYALFLFQSLLLGAGALLVYRLGLVKGLEKRYAVLTAVCYLLYKPLRSANEFDFREDNLFVPILLGALLCAETRRWWGFWALTVASWTVKENASIYTAMLGGWLAASPKSRRHGLALILVSLPVFYAVNAKLTPYFAGGAARTRVAARLGAFGNTGIEVLHSILAHPLRFFGKLVRMLLEKNTVIYVLTVLTPFLAFANKARWPLAIAAAGLGMNVLMGVDTVGFHYECLLIPFLFYALVAGLGHTRRNTERAALVLLSFLLFFGRGPVHSLRSRFPDEHQRFVTRELARIPGGPHVSVSTQSALHPHLTHRKDAFIIPEGLGTADYVIADLHPDTDRYATPALESDLRKIDERVYEKILDRDSLMIWRKKTDAPKK